MCECADTIGNGFHFGREYERLNVYMCVGVCALDGWMELNLLVPLHGFVCLYIFF